MTDAKVGVLTQWIWTESDFDEMGWHDVRIHACAANPENHELLFDIDYIMQWEPPIPSAIGFTFWIAPATLVFAHVSEVEMQFASVDGSFAIEDIQRFDAQTTPNGKLTHWRWLIDGNAGSVRFRATGYRQYLRRQPVPVAAQQLTYEQRGGFSFSREREV